MKNLHTVHDNLKQRIQSEVANKIEMDVKGKSISVLAVTTMSYILLNSSSAPIDAPTMYSFAALVGSPFILSSAIRSFYSCKTNQVIDADNNFFNSVFNYFKKKVKKKDQQLLNDENINQTNINEKNINERTVSIKNSFNIFYRVNKRSDRLLNSIANIRLTIEEKNDLLELYGQLLNDYSNNRSNDNVEKLKQLHSRIKHGEFTYNTWIILYELTNETVNKSVNSHSFCEHSDCNSDHNVQHNAGVNSVGKSVINSAANFVGETKPDIEKLDRLFVHKNSDHLKL